MGRDEQKEEREVLESIFPDEITDASDTEYRVTVTLDIDLDDNEEAPPALVLRVQYPDAYPDVAPELDLSNLPNAPRYRFLDVHADKAHLLEALSPSIEENLGMAMVFTLVSTLKDSAEMLIAERRAEARRILDVEAAKQEQEENKKFQGSAVTRESFLEWRNNFKRESDEAEARRVEEKEAEEKKKRGGNEEKRLTGKELFQRGLVGKAGDEDEDEGDDALVGMEKLKVEA